MIVDTNTKFSDCTSILSNRAVMKSLVTALLESIDQSLLSKSIIDKYSLIVQSPIKISVLLA